MRFVASLIPVVLLLACGGPTRMGGFHEPEARALVSIEAPADACALRSGRLIVEVQRVLVREYPHVVLPSAESAKQPMLLLWLRGERQVGRPPEVELVTVAAPESYHDGDRVRVLEGRRLLDRAVRTLGDRTLEFRLAENDRTLQPRWAEVSHLILDGGGVGASTLGWSAPIGGLSKLLDLLRQIDKDDQILVWSTSIGDLLARVGTAPRLVHVGLRTTRTIVDKVSGVAVPSAEVDLLVYVEPEPGCGAS